MRLVRVHVISAATCGGLLDGLDVRLRAPSGGDGSFTPLCLVGPNGAGKSQFLQVLAEMFQAAFHGCLSNEERCDGNPELQFILEYLIRPPNKDKEHYVRVSRQSEGKARPRLMIELRVANQWTECDLGAEETRELLPTKVVGYTSGDNETLSLPFLVSRSGYAEEVGKRALKEETQSDSIPDTRLMLIDYGTHLEVLVANLLLGSDDQRAAILNNARLKRLHSFRCIVQLAHAAAPKLTPRKIAKPRRKGIQLTAELESYVKNLQSCSTCHTYDEKSETYIFDFWVNDQTHGAFRSFWRSALELYASFHKLAMLNDLAIPKSTRERFRRDTKTRRFASRLPEPQDEDKVFRFERVSFISESGGEPVDYVSLSDGEHQFAQLLGTLCMLSSPNVVFLLDEPESHFNPQWRVKLISRMLDMPTNDGVRRNGARVAEQECVLTTHAPFVPSDMSKDKVFIFGKKTGVVEKTESHVSITQPAIETYGSTFDTILEECFGVRPPMSEIPRKEIEQLMISSDLDAIKAAISRLGDSVEKVFLMDRLRQLSQEQRD